MASYRVDRERWAQFDIFEQMGNIGSEVGRAINAYRKGDEKRFDGALERALDLFSATVELLVAEKPHRAREVLLARDEFLRLFFEGTFDTDAEAVERYFMQYALVARKRHLAKGGGQA